MADAVFIFEKEAGVPLKCKKSFKGNGAWDLWIRKYRLICMHFPPPLLIFALFFIFQPAQKSSADLLMFAQCP